MATNKKIKNIIRVKWNWSSHKTLNNMFKNITVDSKPQCYWNGMRIIKTKLLLIFATCLHCALDGSSQKHLDSHTQAIPFQCLKPPFRNICSSSSGCLELARFQVDRCLFNFISGWHKRIREIGAMSQILCKEYTRESQIKDSLYDVSGLTFPKEKYDASKLPIKIYNK